MATWELVLLIYHINLSFLVSVYVFAEFGFIIVSKIFSDKKYFVKEESKLQPGHDYIKLHLWKSFICMKII